MPKEIISVGPNESVGDTARKILGNQIIAMPAVQNGKAYGMLFIEDLLDHYLRSAIA